MKFIEQVKNVFNSYNHKEAARSFYENELKRQILCRASRGYCDLEIWFPKDDHLIRYDDLSEILSAEELIYQKIYSLEWQEGVRINW